MSMIGKTLGTFTLEAQIGKGAWEKSIRQKTKSTNRFENSRSVIPESDSTSFGMMQTGNNFSH